ncbi:MAG: hypothetical protein D4R64_02480 [Porphyromonadaceae bacterium]|nr:MAG: hypothetical protein D4R64_02480 [Porphyromonadaceae bacterium]
MESEKILKIAVKNLVESPYQGRYMPVNFSDEVKSDKSLAELARNIKDQGLPGYRCPGVFNRRQPTASKPQDH